jgi:hypothetical protein
MASECGVIVEARGTEHVVSICLSAEAVSTLVMHLAACANQHALLAAKPRRRSRK